jgi:hypothetical protein
MTLALRVRRAVALPFIALGAVLVIAGTWLAGEHRPF